MARATSTGSKRPPVMRSDSTASSTDISRSSMWKPLSTRASSAPSTATKRWRSRVSKACFSTRRERAPNENTRIAAAKPVTSTIHGHGSRLLIAIHNHSLLFMTSICLIIL